VMVNYVDQMDVDRMDEIDVDRPPNKDVVRVSRIFFSKE
jgi:hypothetical protein